MWSHKGYQNSLWLLPQTGALLDTFVPVKATVPYARDCSNIFLLENEDKFSTKRTTRYLLIWLMHVIHCAPVGTNTQWLEDNRRPLFPMACCNQYLLRPTSSLFGVVRIQRPDPDVKWSNWLMLDSLKWQQLTPAQQSHFRAKIIKIARIRARNGSKLENCPTPF